MLRAGLAKGVPAMLICRDAILNRACECAAMEGSSKSGSRQSAGCVGSRSRMSLFQRDPVSQHRRARPS